jgi:hypothetical protein
MSEREEKKGVQQAKHQPASASLGMAGDDWTETTLGAMALGCHCVSIRKAGEHRTRRHPRPLEDGLTSANLRIADNTFRQERRSFLVRTHGKTSSVDPMITKTEVCAYRNNARGKGATRSEGLADTRIVL